jgi:integrase
LVRVGKDKNERVRYLSDSEETALRTVVAKSYNEHLPELEIALMTGMRQGEQFGLTWDRVDLDNATLRLNKTKNGKPRFVRLNSRALVVLRASREFSLGGTVPEPRGKRKSARACGRVFLLNLEPYWFADAIEEAGISDFHWHDLRHTFASRLVMAGVDIRTVQELLGHETITITMRYAHLSPQHAVQAVEKICKPSATSSATRENSDSNPVALSVQ